MPECPINDSSPAWTGMSLSVLQEIAQKLKHLADGGTPEAIDLRSLPLNPLDMTDLKAQLGTGEVQATLTLSGETLVEETCYPGVWLITHLGPEGDILVQLIEITKVPDLLMAQDSDITASADRLNQLLTAPAPGTMPPDRQEDVAHV